jgi:hypothetical protein
VAPTGVDPVTFRFSVERSDRVGGSEQAEFPPIYWDFAGHFMHRHAQSRRVMATPLATLKLNREATPCAVRVKARYTEFQRTKSNR